MNVNQTHEQLNYKLKDFTLKAVLCGDVTVIVLSRA